MERHRPGFALPFHPAGPGIAVTGKRHRTHSDGIKTGQGQSHPADPGRAPDASVHAALINGRLMGVAEEGELGPLDPKVPLDLAPTAQMKKAGRVLQAGMADGNLSDLTNQRPFRHPTSRGPTQGFPGDPERAGHRLGKILEGQARIQSHGIVVAQDRSADGPAQHLQTRLRIRSIPDGIAEEKHLGHTGPGNVIQHGGQGVPGGMHIREQGTMIAGRRRNGFHQSKVFASPGKHKGIFARGAQVPGPAGHDLANGIPLRQSGRREEQWAARNAL
jgi:hypothetical protein